MDHSITYTRNEIIDQITHTLICQLNKDDEMIQRIIREGFSSGLHKHVCNLNGKTDSDIAILWCEHVSEQYFQNNHEVEDVLMLIRQNSEKMWVCSRTDLTVQTDR